MLGCLYFANISEFCYQYFQCKTNIDKIFIPNITNVCLLLGDGLCKDIVNYFLGLFI